METMGKEMASMSTGVATQSQEDIGTTTFGTRVNLGNKILSEFSQTDEDGEINYASGRGCTERSMYHAELQ